MGVPLVPSAHCRHRSLTEAENALRVGIIRSLIGAGAVAIVGGLLLLLLFFYHATTRPSNLSLPYEHTALLPSSLLQVIYLIRKLTYIISVSNF